MNLRVWILSLIVTLSANAFVHAQDEPKPESPTDAPVATSPETEKPSTAKNVKETTDDLTKQAKDEASKIADVLDHDPRAKTAAAGILQPIYLVAESLAFPAFHWLAFALMSAGVVSYALQLGIGKLIVLTRMGFSLKEILSDTIGLLISVVGLVLTTQAAAENSTFTQSPAAVLSATAAGAILGIILYFWGQSQEIQAAAGRSRTPAPKK